MSDQLNRQAIQAARDLCATAKTEIRMEIPGWALVTGNQRDVQLAKLFLRACGAIAKDHGLEFVEWRDNAEDVQRYALRRARA